MHKEVEELNNFIHLELYQPFKQNEKRMESHAQYITEFKKDFRVQQREI